MFNTDKDHAKRMQLEQNRVIVRIWSSASDPDRPGANVGHVSLEMQDAGEVKYMSLWPAQAGPFQDSARDTEGLGITEGISHEFVGSFEKDRDVYEKRAPEYTFCFYTLDRAAMMGAYNDAKQNIKGWCLLGARCEGAHSCASIVWTLLRAGGIDELIAASKLSTADTKKSSQGFFGMFAKTASSDTEGSKINAFLTAEFTAQALAGTNSPDSLAVRLILAKKAEIKREPAEGLEVEGEYRPTTEADAGAAAAGAGAGAGQ